MASRSNYADEINGKSANFNVSEVSENLFKENYLPSYNAMSSCQSQTADNLS
jgi:hypothetical protein